MITIYICINKGVMVFKLSRTARAAWRSNRTCLGKCREDCGDQRGQPKKKTLAEACPMVESKRAKRAQGDNGVRRHLRRAN